MYFDIIPITADFRDKQALLFEHSLINKEHTYLTHAIIKVNDIYHWLITDDIGSQIKFHTDDEKIICPCCEEELFIRAANSSKIKTHFCHYSNKSNDCEFKKRYKSNPTEREISKGNKDGESDIHIVAKEQLAILINTSSNFGHDVYLNKVKDFTIKTDHLHQSHIYYTYEPVKIVKAELEKQIVKKEGELAGFRSDLNIYDEHGNIYFIEVTYSNGKSISQYYNRWQRGASTVYEVKALKTSIDLSNLIRTHKSNNNETKDYFLISNIKEEREGIEMQLLYDPIHHKGQQELMKHKALNMKKRKKAIFNELSTILKEARRHYGLFLKQNKTSQKWHHHKVGSNEFVKSDYYLINYRDVTFEQKIPQVVANYLKDRKKIEIIKRYSTTSKTN